MKYLVFIFIAFGSFLCVPLQGQYVLEKLNSNINTEYDEISPIVLEDGKTLFFTRLGSPDFQKTLFQNHQDLSTSLSQREYADLLQDVYSQIANEKIDKPIDSDFNQDVWIAVSEQGSFDRIIHPGFPINNALPNSICAYSFKDYSLMVINQFGKDGSLYHGFSKTRQLSVDNFEFPEPVYIYDFYSKSSAISATISYDGDIIILSLEREDSHGDLDLYASFKVKENVWSEPVNLGTDINTSSREITPFLARDKKRLFFASNRNDGLGGMDIYVARRLDVNWKKWSKPRRLLAPINSESDDTQPFYDEFNNYFYFTSKRDGSSDIFRVDLNPEASEKLVVRVKGSVRNKVNKALIPGEIKYAPVDQSLPMNYYNTNDGLFEFNINLNAPYSFYINSEGYQEKMYEIDPEQVTLDESMSLELKIQLDPVKNEIIASTTKPFIQKNDEKFIPLNNIFFVQSKPQILASSFPELNKLVKVLEDNQEIEILIEGHTDNVGDPEALMELSTQRAVGIKEYLVYKGIDANRIQTKGMGASAPLNSNTTELERRQNRRVEVKIIKS